MKNTFTVFKVVIRSVIAVILTIVCLSGLPQYLDVQDVIKNNYSWGPSMQQISMQPSDWNEWYDSALADNQQETISHYGISMTVPSPLERNEIYNDDFGGEYWVWSGGSEESWYSLFLSDAEKDFSGDDEFPFKYIDPYRTFFLRQINYDSDMMGMFSRPVSKSGLSSLAFRKGYGKVSTKYEYEHLVLNTMPEDCPVFGPRAARAYEHCIIEKSYYIMPSYEFDNGSAKGFISSFPSRGKPNDTDDDDLPCYSTYIWVYPSSDMNHCRDLYVCSNDYDLMCAVVDSISGEK